MMYIMYNASKSTKEQAEILQKDISKPEQIKLSAGPIKLNENMFVFCFIIWLYLPFRINQNDDMHLGCRHIGGTEPALAISILYSLSPQPCTEHCLKCKSKIVSWMHKSGFEVIFITFIFFEALAGWEIPAAP